MVFLFMVVECPLTFPVLGLNNYCDSSLVVRFFHLK